MEALKAALRTWSVVSSYHVRISSIPGPYLLRIRSVVSPYLFPFLRHGAGTEEIWTGYGLITVLAQFKDEKA